MPPPSERSRRGVCTYGRIIAVSFVSVRVKQSLDQICGFLLTDRFATIILKTTAYLCADCARILYPIGKGGRVNEAVTRG